MNSFINSSIYVGQLRGNVSNSDNTYLRSVRSLTTHSKVQRIIYELFRICAQVKADGNGRRGFDAGPSDV